MTALETFARVIYEAEPETEERLAGDIVFAATGRRRYVHALEWEALPAEHPYARERALRQAQAVLNFVKKGITS